MSSVYAFVQARAMRLFRKMFKTQVLQKLRPKQYRFVDLPRINTLTYRPLDFSEWSETKRRANEFSLMNAVFLGVFSFMVADVIYTIRYNEADGYYYYINFSSICRLVNKGFDFVENKSKPYLALAPKDIYGFGSLWSNLGALLFTPNIDQKQMAAQKKSKVNEDAAFVENYLSQLSVKKPSMEAVLEKGY